jgi:DNA-binding transcriptional LysR family regulator
MVIDMLLEGHCDLGISAHPVTDSRLKNEVIYTDSVLAVASPAVVHRVQQAESLADALSAAAGLQSGIVPD